ncbi:MAG: hypothetical protein ABF289_09650 [Clostridiales bacterium]
MKKMLFAIIVICFICVGCSSVEKENFIGNWLSESYKFIRNTEISEENGKLNVLIRSGGSVEINDSNDGLTIYIPDEIGAALKIEYKRESEFDINNPYLGEWYSEVEDERIRIKENNGKSLIYEKFENEEWIEDSRINELYFIDKTDVVMTVEYEDEYIGVIKDNYILFDNDEKLYYYSKENIIEFVEKEEDEKEAIELFGGFKKIE